MTATLDNHDAPKLPAPSAGGAGDDKKSDRRLAFLLIAPAVILMLAVTAYPIGYAVWLSLQRYNLAAPDDTAFVGLSNYQTVLTDRYWWTAFIVTLVITIVSVAIEFVLGMALALVMHRTIFGKGVVRTAILIPYGIVTVAASYSWYYAWTPGTGYLANLLPEGSAPLTEQLPSLAIVVLAEVWKTTPFMALLLLAGLALVPQDLLNAAQVDGAGAWKRLTQSDSAAYQTGDPGGAAVPDARRVPHLRQHLRAHRRREQHRIGVDPWLRQPVQSVQPRPRIGDQRADLPVGGDHRVHLHHALRRLGARIRRGEALMAERVGAGRATGWTVVNILVVLYALFPVLWILSLSLKPTSTVKDGKLIPSEITFDNYKGIFSGNAFSSALINSIGIGLITTVIAVVVGGMAAYAVARLSFPGKKLLVGVALLIAMFPQISLVTPIFNMWRSIGLFDTWPGLIIPYITFALPLAIYTLSAFFREIPWDLEKAAKMDGATPAQAFRKVIAPLAAPGIVTAAILVFIFAWNDLLLALSLTATERAITAPVAIANFTGSSQFEEPTGSIAAGAMVITVPIIIFVLIFQRRIVAGLTSGAVKG